MVRGQVAQRESKYPAPKVRRYCPDASSWRLMVVVVYGGGHGGTAGPMPGNIWSVT